MFWLSITENSLRFYCSIESIWGRSTPNELSKSLKPSHSKTDTKRFYYILLRQFLLRWLWDFWNKFTKLRMILLHRSPQIIKVKKSFFTRSSFLTVWLHSFLFFIWSASTFFFYQIISLHRIVTVSSILFYPWGPEKTSKGVLGKRKCLTFIQLNRTFVPLALIFFFLFLQVRSELLSFVP